VSDFDCATCHDTGFVHLVADSGSWVAEPCSADHEMAEECPDCDECPRCCERAPNGEFERPYPEDEAVCANCLDDIRNYAGRDGENDHVPNWNER
jgi:hypothetical protein